MLICCFPWHVGTDTHEDDDVSLVRTSMVCSHAMATEKYPLYFP